MNQETSPNPNPNPNPSTRPIVITISLSCVALVFSIVALLAAMLLPYHQLKTYSTLLQQQLSDQQQQIKQSKKKIQTLFAMNQHGATRAAVIQLGYPLQLAAIELRINHDKKAALNLINNAITTLQSVDDPAVQSLKMSLEADRQQLRQYQSPKPQELLTKISDIKQQCQQLKIVPKLSKPKSTIAIHQDSGWKQTLLTFFASFKDLIIIHRDQTPIRPLLDQQQQLYFKQNLAITLNEVEWALLQYNNEIFQEKLQQAKLMLEQYWPNQQQVIPLANSIEQLRQFKLATLPSLRQSLQAYQAVVMGDSSS